MIQNTKAIVLHQLKYGESSVIVTLFTEEFGRQSYIVNGIRSARAKTKMGLLQPLFLLEIEAYHKAGREVQRLKEFRMAEVYQSLPFDISKSTIAMFLAELLNKTIHREESDATLFEFLHNSLLYFDEMEAGKSNFHLWFMVRLLSYFGFQLENNCNSLNVFFDLKAGCFVPSRPSLPNTPDTEESAYLSKLIRLDVAELEQYTINGDMRSRLLGHLVEYYSIHFEGIGAFQSLAVLKDIFH